MKPIDFVVFDGDSSPNTPVYKIAEALKKDIVVCGMDGEYEILSYYFSGGQFYLDVQKKVRQCRK